MKVLFVFGVALGAAIVLAPSQASAQNRAPVYRYCLMNNSHPGEVGSLLCRFDTLAQCLASRHSLGDTCLINPELVGRK
jgi:hypothetical protein